MDKDEMSRIFEDAKDIIAKLDPAAFPRDKITWNALEPQRVVHLVEYFGPKTQATSVSLFVGPASPFASDLRSAIALELVKRGHIGVNVLTEW